jgi:hypothetical protein
MQRCTQAMPILAHARASRLQATRNAAWWESLVAHFFLPWFASKLLAWGTSGSVMSPAPAWGIEAGGWSG